MVCVFTDGTFGKSFYPLDVWGEHSCTDGAGASEADGQKRRRSRPLVFDIRSGVSRLCLIALRAYAAVGFPDDRGELLLATEH